MTALDRTAYPRPGDRLTREEVEARYDLTDTDHGFIQTAARGDAGRLTLAALLKTRQAYGLFLAPSDLPAAALSHMAVQLAMPAPPPLVTDKQALHRYRTAIRAHLGLTPFSQAGEGVVTAAVLGFWAQTPENSGMLEFQQLR